MFAWEHEPKAKPDAIILGKALGGGVLPISAVLASEEVMDVFDPGSHGSTFGGNPLAMACANAVLDVVLKDGFLDSVNAMSNHLWKGLNNLVAKYPDHLAGVRGKGLLLGLQFQGDGSEAGTMVAKVNALGLLSVPAGDNVMRMIPPLVIENAHVDEALGILDTALAETATEAS